MRVGERPGFVLHFEIVEVKEAEYEPSDDLSGALAMKDVIVDGGSDDITRFAPQ